jgi:hypothetical protein
MITSVLWGNAWRVPPTAYPYAALPQAVLI